MIEALVPVRIRAARDLERFGRRIGNNDETANAGKQALAGCGGGV